MLPDPTAPRAPAADHVRRGAGTSRVLTTDDIVLRLRSRMFARLRRAVALACGAAVGVALLQAAAVWLARYDTAPDVVPGGVTTLDMPPEAPPASAQMTPGPRLEVRFSRVGALRVDGMPCGKKRHWSLQLSQGPHTLEARFGGRSFTHAIYVGDVALTWRCDVTRGWRQLAP